MSKENKKIHSAQFDHKTFILIEREAARIRREKGGAVKPTWVGLIKDWARRGMP